MDVSDLEQVEGMESPIYLTFNYTAGSAISRFLRSIKQGKLVGQRSPATGKVIIPPLGACPESGQPTVEEVPLPDCGTVLGYTIVHLPIPGSELKPPFAVVNILLDGADQAFSHLLSECPNDAVEIGMRVEAVWKPEDQWDYGLDNILYFTPTGEPLEDIEQLKAACLARAEEARNA
ncbi:MAG: Zn-ribbon domain-containing OB-fold protein [Pseudomonadales bacterium]